MNKTLLRMLCVLFFVVILVSAGVLYFTFDVRALVYLTTFKWYYALLALGVLSVGLFFDATRLITLTRLSGEKMDYAHIFYAVFSNYFLALLTPGQGGGGIAMLMFMKRAGVPVAKSTLIVIVRTVFSILFLFLMMPLVFWFDPELVSWMPTSPRAEDSIHTRGMKKMPWRAMERKVAGPVRPMVCSIIWLMTVQLRKKKVTH